MNVSIVIPTLNGGPLFQEVLARLRSQRYPHPVELLVIDSGSTDGTVAHAKAAGARVLEIPRREFDHGLTRNRGIQETAGDVVLLMTQDAVPADDQLLGKLVAAFEDHRVAGAFARQIPRPDADALVTRNIRNWIAGSDTARVSEIVDPAAYQRLRPMQKYLFCVFDNVCSAVRRSVWRDIPFHQNAFGEDIEWAKRALEAGWKILYEPGAAVVHSHDRPIAYEYKRTYMCHQALYRLFGLQTMPARRYLPRALVRGIIGDLAYALRHQPGLGRKLSLAAKVPFLAWYSALGQYRGARDARLDQAIRHTDV
ncbi:MAG TPA: glycosyltransferase [Phycisphaerae bacterium]|nr:glycosyltransferase [Phycisphaerae bacterium]